ncbi:hypothetical protein [Nitratireductor sp. XY-223]|uniref:hypothetical protein n=1 Tax=Nitratireductor sp. XY-223 TaxID=2561926 RepID=UPI0010A9B760|nr:hypothetical protein [Nitratireductor sp. XY-223]
MPNSESAAELIEHSLLEILSLPNLSQRGSANADDLAIDITVSDYDLGCFQLLYAHQFSVPLVWRPEVIMTARVYAPGSNNTICAHTVRYKPGWIKWIRMNLNLRKHLKELGKYNPRDAKSAVGTDDLKYFVRQSCVDLLIKVQRDI